MYRRISGTGSLLGLMALVSIAAPMDSHAQGAQHKQSDLAFIRSMSSRLQNVERQSERLEDQLGELSSQAGHNIRMGQDQYGHQTSRTPQDRQRDYRSAERKMRSNRKRAAKERERLAELQRAGDSVSAEQREKTERIVSDLERNVANMERDIRQRRF